MFRVHGRGNLTPRPEQYSPRRREFPHRGSALSRPHPFCLQSSQREHLTVLPQAFRDLRLLHTNCCNPSDFCRPKSKLCPRPMGVPWSPLTLNAWRKRKVIVLLNLMGDRKMEGPPGSTRVPALVAPFPLISPNPCPSPKERSPPALTHRILGTCPCWRLSRPSLVKTFVSTLASFLCHTLVSVTPDLLDPCPTPVSLTPDPQLTESGGRQVDVAVRLDPHLAHQRQRKLPVLQRANRQC